MAENQGPTSLERLLAGLVSSGILLVGRIIHAIFQAVFSILSALASSF